MNILDDLEEYTKLISRSNKSDSETKLNELKDKLDSHSEQLEKIKESQEIHKNDFDSRISQFCIDLELQKREHNNLLDSNNTLKLNYEGLQGEIDELKEYRQNMEDYKKVTNERIEKLIKLFLSINK